MSRRRSSVSGSSSSCRTPAVSRPLVHVATRDRDPDATRGSRTSGTRRTSAEGRTTRRSRGRSPIARPPPRDATSRSTPSRTPPPTGCRRSSVPTRPAPGSRRPAGRCGYRTGSRIGPSSTPSARACTAARRCSATAGALRVRTHRFVSSRRRARCRRRSTRAPPCPGCRCGRRGCWAGGSRFDRSQLRDAEARTRILGGDLDGLVQVGAFEDVEAGDLNVLVGQRSAWDPAGRSGHGT